MEQLRKLRRERGLTQAQLAVQAGLDPSSLSQIETGARRPNTRTLEKLAGVLGVEVRDLFPLGQAPLPLEEDGRSSAPEVFDGGDGPPPGQKPHARFDRWLEEHGAHLHTERWEAFLERIDEAETEDLYELRRKFEEADRALLEAAASHPDPHQIHRVIDRGTPRWMVIGLTLGRRALGQDVPAREVARGLVGAGHT
ncbi:MAG: helix-turn-helix domain-containing protein [Actinomycetota bacterium]|nr:helix-turn-helix domain-containing protein [Actinomycetota bacterium]